MTKQPDTEKMKFSKPAKIIFGILFILYLLILVKIILFKYSSFEDILSGNVSTFSSYNLTPFKTIVEYITVSGMSFFRIMANIVGNMFVFTPLGFLLPIIFTRMQHLWKILITAFTLSAFFELMQLIFSLGSLDADDVILNVCGALLGYGVFKLFMRIFKSIKVFYIATAILILISGSIAFYVAYDEFGHALGLRKYEDVTFGKDHIPDGGEKQFADNDSINKNEPIEGYVEDIENDVIALNIITTEKEDDGSETASSGIGQYKNIFTFKISKQTEYTYMLIDQSSKILEKRKGTEKDMQKGQIVEILGHMSDNGFTAHTVNITEVQK